MKRFVIKFLLIILLLCVLFYIDSYYPFVVVGICFLVFLIAFPIFAINDDWKNILLVCISFGIAFGWYVYIGFRVEPWGDDRIALVTPFYPLGKVIAVGEKVDTLQQLPLQFVSNEGKISVEHRTVFVLHLDSTSSLLFSSNQIILKKGRSLQLEKKFFEYDSIEVVTYFDDHNNNQKTIDLFGHDASDPKYFPNIKTIPVTPDYY